jgi:hypothetical protein
MKRVYDWIEKVSVGMLIATFFTVPNSTVLHGFEVTAAMTIFGVGSVLLIGGVLLVESTA